MAGKDPQKAWGLISFQTTGSSPLVNCEIKSVMAPGIIKQQSRVGQNALCSESKYCFVKPFNRVPKCENWLPHKVVFLTGGGLRSKRVEDSNKGDEACLPEQWEANSSVSIR